MRMFCSSTTWVLLFSRAGDAFALYGNATCLYDVSVDGQPPQINQPATGLLFQEDSLSQTSHNVTITAHASAGQLFSFDRADISQSGG